MIGAAFWVAFAAVLPAQPRLADLRWHRRVLLVAAPRGGDPALVEQRRLLAGWQAGSAERDLDIVTVTDSDVAGVSDAGAALRSRYQLTPGAFTVILIGKDGGEKLRSHQPLTPARLEAEIDAMPMRRAGER